MKKSSYNRLKEENESLKKDIYNLVVNKDKEEGVIIFCKWKLKFDVDRMVMQGSIHNDNLTGLL